VVGLKIDAMTGAGATQYEDNELRNNTIDL
jgi:hypothetical protein